MAPKEGGIIPHAEYVDLIEIALNTRKKRGIYV